MYNPGDKFIVSIRMRPSGRRVGLFVAYAAVLQQFDSVYILSNADSHFFSGFHRQYNGLRTVNNVTTGEYTAAGGHAEGAFADDHISLFVYFDSLRCTDNAVGRT